MGGIQSVRRHWMAVSAALLLAAASASGATSASAPAAPPAKTAAPAAPVKAAPPVAKAADKPTSFGGFGAAKPKAVEDKPKVVEDRPVRKEAATSFGGFTPREKPQAQGSGAAATAPAARIVRPPSSMADDMANTAAARNALRTLDERNRQQPDTRTAGSTGSSSDNVSDLRARQAAREAQLERERQAAVLEESMRVQRQARLARERLERRMAEEERRASNNSRDAEMAVLRERALNAEMAAARARAQAQAARERAAAANDSWREPSYPVGVPSVPVTRDRYPVPATAGVDPGALSRGAGAAAGAATAAATAAANDGPMVLGHGRGMDALAGGAAPPATDMAPAARDEGGSIFGVLMFALLLAILAAAGFMWLRRRKSQSKSGRYAL